MRSSTGRQRDADDGLDLAGLDERHHDGAAFRDEHRVAEPLGFVLEILDGAKAALLAEQAEFIERRGAFALHAQALRHQQQPALVGDGGERFAPHFVVQTNCGVVKVNFGRAGDLMNFAGVNFQLVLRHRRNGIVRLHVFANGG